MVLSFLVIGIASNADSSYYSSITDTSSGSSLASSLHTLISNTHTTKLSYDDVWTAYETTDTFPGTAKIWDPYSEYIYTYGTDQTGSSGYQDEGDNYNREHTVPQSWFSKASPMVADVFHILATDGKVNGIRSNYPYGEVGTADTTTGNGSMLGTSSLSGYSGTVFEPIDEYKGDIARGYFYMAIRYSDKVGNWTSDAKSIFSGSYPYLTDYALDLFTKWSHLDPVSDKETIRNDAIENLQGNRNPFIDNPDWIDIIWNNSYTDTDSNTKYSVSDVNSAISALTTNSNDDAIYAAYAKYARLNTADKSSVTDSSTLFSLVESTSGTSTDLDTYWANIIGDDGTVNQDEVDNVIALIDSIPSTITLSSEAAIVSAEEVYAALNSNEQALVTNYSELTAARTTLDSIMTDINEFRNLSTKSSMKFSYTSETSGSGSTSYNLVSSVSDLEDGDSIIITANGYDTGMGAISNSYGTSVAVTKGTSTLTDIGSALTFELEATSTSNAYYLKNDSGYLTSTTVKKLSFVSSSSSASVWTISISSGVATIVTNSTYSLQYNSQSPRFTTYTSSQVSLALYEVSLGATTTYSYSNMYMRYGAGLEADLYNDLLSLGSSVTFGVATSLDNSTFTNHACTPVRVDSIGASAESSTGNYYQYSIIFSVPANNYSTVVYAKAYVIIDGNTYYMNSASYSVETLAKYYVTNLSDQIAEESLNALGGLY
ncbi:MAG: endonuclease [Acholeplasmatales bacterium]|nr:endonuclease [Acholeplasmatales bacterium]